MTENVTHKAELLLTRAAETRKRFEEHYRASGSQFNIFTISGTHNKEVQMCRVFANLLDPKGSHYQGSLYLKLFWETLLPKLPEPLKTLDCNVARVFTEYTTNENRRIDIGIEDGRLFVPIEVKIRAGDQPKAVSDYAAFARERSGGAMIPVLYLTPDGHAPHDAREGEYIQLSFSEALLPWLKKCRDTAETPLPVQEIVNQLIGSIETQCSTPEDKEMDEIFNLITKDDDSVKAALAIREAAGRFEPKVKKAFKDSIMPLLKNALPDAEGPMDSGDGWYFIEISINQGKYTLNVDYDWKSLYTYASQDKRNAEEEKILSQKMNALTGVSGISWPEKTGIFWINTEKLTYPTLALDDKNLYLYELYKLYTQRPQEVVDRIVSMARTLEEAIS
jgi:hypothetical protein